MGWGTCEGCTGNSKGELSIARPPFNAAPSRDGPRANEQIDAPQIRLIDYTGDNLGVVTIGDAMARAQETGLDLVEISPNADPPVCKILDYGKLKYEEQKKRNVARKKQKIIEVKEIKMRPNIDVHDYDFKMRAIHRFLGDGDKVKVTMRFRGREMAHQEIGIAGPGAGARRSGGAGQGRADPQDGGPPNDHGDGPEIAGLRPTPCFSG